MTEHEDGGPAFPQAEYFDEKRIGEMPGMTLRDYFAAQALAGLLAAGAVKTATMPPGAYRFTASVAYHLADAMIAERAV